MNITANFRNKRVLLLYDISKSNMTIDNKIAELFNKYTCVIALTSRESKFSQDNVEVVETLIHHFSLEKIKYGLFTRQEVLCIIDFLESNVEVETLQRQMLLSPVLVMLYLLSQDRKKDALDKLQSKFMLHLNTWSSSMTLNPREVMSSMYFLRNIGHAIKECDELEAFSSCFLALHNLLFLDKSNIITTSCINIYSKLLDILSRVRLNLTVVSELDKRFVNAVKGERL